MSRTLHKYACASSIIGSSSRSSARHGHQRGLAQKLGAPRRARRAVKEDAADEHDDEKELRGDEFEGQASFLREPPADVRGDCKYQVTKRVGPLETTDLRLAPFDGHHPLPAAVQTPRQRQQQ